MASRWRARQWHARRTRARLRPVRAGRSEVRGPRRAEGEVHSRAAAPILAADGAENEMLPSVFVRVVRIRGVHDEPDGVLERIVLVARRPDDTRGLRMQRRL